MKLYGKEVKKQEISKRIGNISQIADAREGMLTYGKADGVRVIDVKTGGGLSFTVLPSRGMDIAWAEYKGFPIAFIAKPGVVGPQYFEKDGFGFFRNFFAGLLTTCGITYNGAPCVDEGWELGVHGRISNIPAHDVGIVKEWEEDEYMIRIRGKVAEQMCFMEDMVLTREITVKAGENCIHIHDIIENCGNTEWPVMLLYHCNFGYPLVSENTVLLESEKAKVVARDEAAEKGIDTYATFEEPTNGYAEQVFFHDFSDTEGEEGYACLYNKEYKIGAYVKFNKEQLPYFAQWKMMNEKEYAVGLEPSNSYPTNRVELRKMEKLQTLKPGEKKHFEFSIGIYEGEI